MTLSTRRLRKGAVAMTMALALPFGIAACTEDQVDDGVVNEEDVPEGTDLPPEDLTDEEQNGG